MLSAPPPGMARARLPWRAFSLNRRQQSHPLPPAGPAFSLRRRHITMGNVATRLFAKTEMRILVQGLDAAGMYRRAIKKNPLASIQIVTAAPVICYDPASACSPPPASCCFFLANAPILSMYPDLLSPSPLRQKRCTLPRLVLRGSLSAKPSH